MLPLSVVIPATNRPATLDRCLAAVRAAVRPRRRGDRRRRSPGAHRDRGPQHRRRPGPPRRPRVRRRRRRGAPRRARADPRRVRRPGDDRGVRLVRRLRRRCRPRSRPSATCCTTTCTRPTPDPPTSFWTGLGAVRRERVRGGRRVRRRALPRAVDRGHRPRPAPRRAGRDDPPRPRHPGQAPEGVDVAVARSGPTSPRAASRGSR